MHEKPEKSIALTLWNLPVLDDKVASADNLLNFSQISKDTKGLAIFKNELFYALLHSKCDQKTIDAVIKQLQEKGVSYVLCKVSHEAKQFRNWARQVKMEKMRAVSFIRLRPIDQHNVLYGEFELRHKTGEIIILHFMNRFPTYKIMISFGKEAFIGKDGQIAVTTRLIASLPPTLIDPFEKLWLTFYKSQYIPERKNLRYMQQMVPKKYWKWLREIKEFGVG